MTELPALPESKPRVPRARTIVPTARASRTPTGVSPWPIMLIAGGPKADTARFAAVASGSELIGRTLWLSWQERTPDALGAIPGARFEILDHDDSLDDFEDAIEYVVGLPAEGKPNLLVIDGVSQLADSVKDWARTVSPGTGYWLTVGERWRGILKTLRSHAGPVILIARLGGEGEGVIGHRDLVADVDVYAEVSDDDIATVTATRTEPPLRDLEVFDVETVWLTLNISVVKS